MQIEVWNTVAQSVDFNLEINISDFKKFINQDTPILDYGCGYGRTCEILFTQGYTNIVGVDTSPEMIKRGNKEYPKLSLQQNSDIKTRFPNNHFGAIVFCAVLTCIPDQQEKENIIVEINRLLKPGGILHMIEFCNDTGKYFESNLGVNMHHQQPKGLLHLLKNFSKLECKITKERSMTGKNVEAIRYFGKKDINNFKTT